MLLKGASAGNSDASAPMVDDVPPDVPSPAPPRRKQLVSVIPGEPSVPIPRLRWRLLARCRQTMLSLPLWALNLLTAGGIGMLLLDLCRSPEALVENLAAFSCFAVVLPGLLILTNGQATANTHAAWASLRGQTDGRTRLVHALLLAMMIATVALAAVLTVYTSSSRAHRWLRCAIVPPEVEVVEVEVGSASGGKNATTVVVAPVSGSGITAEGDVWQCGDAFFA